MIVKVLGLEIDDLMIYIKKQSKDKKMILTSN